MRWAAVIVGALAATVISLGGAAPANADGPIFDDGTSDVTFRASLTNQGLLFNFPLEKYQGQRFCQSIIDGDRPLKAYDDLARDGGYSPDVATGIGVAASIAYCDCTYSAVETPGSPFYPNLCSSFELNQPRRRF